MFPNIQNTMQVNAAFLNASVFSHTATNIAHISIFCVAETGVYTYTLFKCIVLRALLDTFLQWKCMGCMYKRFFWLHSKLKTSAFKMTRGLQTEKNIQFVLLFFFICSNRK